MFSEAIYAYLVVCSLILQGHAHGVIAPMLGVKGTPVRSDVQRPSTAKPCGNVNPATTIGNSQAATADAQGNVHLTAINFNGGADGSRKVTAQVSTDGTGKNLKAATVSTNGDAAPKNVSSQPLVVQLPAGTKCTGGKTGDLCLMALKTTSGFGNCVVVKQGGTATPPVPKQAAAKGGKGANSESASTTTASAAPKNTAAKDGKDGSVKQTTDMDKTAPTPDQDQKRSAAKPAGARAVRSILSSKPVKRSGFLSWIWA